MIIMSIDPGLTKSGYVVSNKLIPKECGKIDNDSLIDLLHSKYEIGLDLTIIERPVCRKWAGSEVSDTAIWCGRFIEASPCLVSLINRQKVRMVLVGKTANDSKIRKYLINRFEPGYTLKEPGMFEGFHDDVWQAFALTVTYLIGRGEMVK